MVRISLCLGSQPDGAMTTSSPGSQSVGRGEERVRVVELARALASSRVHVVRLETPCRLIWEENQRL